MSDVTLKMAARALNFAAGPGALPLAVLERAQAELLAYGGAGVSVLEMSHRAKEFETILGYGRVGGGRTDKERCGGESPREPSRSSRRSLRTGW